MKYIRRVLISIGLAATFFAGMLALTPNQTVYAEKTSQEVACEAINGSEGCTKSNSDLTGLIRVIVEVMSIIIGVLAVIMIIFAGAKYVTSGGDTAKVTAAKNALIYALIGLAIVAMSQFLVRVVIRETKAATSYHTRSLVA